MSIWVTPFCDYWLVDFIVSTFGFTTTFIHCIYYGMEGEGALAILEIPMWWSVIFFAIYFTRHVLTEFFLMHVEAENTRDTLTQILDNLPDAVLMLESDQLSYCNQ